MLLERISNRDPTYQITSFGLLEVRGPTDLGLQRLSTAMDRWSCLYVLRSCWERGSQGNGMKLKGN